MHLFYLNSIHNQYRIPFTLLDCCERFPYRINFVVLGSCAAKHEKVSLFSERGKEVTALLEIFLQCCPISISDSVVSIYSSLQHRMPSGPGRHCPPVKNLHKKKTISTLKVLFSSLLKPLILKEHLDRLLMILSANTI